jgi:hypothetical protein
MTDLPPSLPVANGWECWPGCGARAATLSDGSREGYQIYLDVIETAWGDDPVANLNPNLRDQPFGDPRRALPKPLLKTRARLDPHGEGRQ